MKLTEAIQKAGEMLTGHNPDMDQMTHLTLVTNVSKQFQPHCDFNINGTIVDSLPIAEFNKKYAGKDLSAIDDFSKADIKVMWSTAVITATDENSPFLPNLVVRFVSCCNETGIVEVVALRNKYGSSLVQLPLPV